MAILPLGGHSVIVNRLQESRENGIMMSVAL